MLDLGKKLIDGYVAYCKKDKIKTAKAQAEVPAATADDDPAVVQAMEQGPKAGCTLALHNASAVAAMTRAVSTLARAVVEAAASEELVGEWTLYSAQHPWLAPSLMKAATYVPGLKHMRCSRLVVTRAPWPAVMYSHSAQMYQ